MKLPILLFILFFSISATNDDNVLELLFKNEVLRRMLAIQVVVAVIIQPATEVVLFVKLGRNRVVEVVYISMNY